MENKPPACPRLHISSSPGPLALGQTGLLFSPAFPLLLHASITTGASSLSAHTITSTLFELLVLQDCLWC